MELIYVLGIVLQVGILIFFFRRSMGKKKKQEKIVAVPSSMTSYESSRYTALHVTPDNLNLQIPPSLTKVYGVVMDWDMGGTLLTLNAYINGAANAFLSSGASAMGGGNDPAVAEQASEFVVIAQDYLNRAVPVSDLGFPPPGTVRFYLLTNRGIYAVQELLALINDNSSPLLGLFFRGNMLLDEIKASKAGK
jgi:hypothetical protein